METIIKLAVEKIECQQNAEGTAIFMVGEQLKDMCRRSAKDAELVVQDLEIAEMSLARAEKKIKAYADAHRKGSFSCVTPAVAEDILRQFYGLSEGGKLAPSGPATPVAKAELVPILPMISLEDFF